MASTEYGVLSTECRSSALRAQHEERVIDQPRRAEPDSDGQQGSLRQALGSMMKSTDDPRTHVDDVLALQPGGLVIRMAHSGTARDGESAHEGQRLQLWIFGTDGLLAQCEWFDADRGAEALARFGDFTAVVAQPAPAGRAVIANDATAFGARVDAAVAARDRDAMGALIAHYHRQLTGQGQQVDVSAQACLLWAFSHAHTFWDLNRQLEKRAGSFMTGRSITGAKMRVFWP